MPATFQGRVDAFWARLPGILQETLYNEMVCPKPFLLTISALIPSLSALVVFVLALKPPSLLSLIPLSVSTPPFQVTSV